MKFNILFTMAIGLLAAGAASAQEGGRQSGPETVQATYLITGLHCPPCTKTAERSLTSLPGIDQATVDWKTKAAKVAFDAEETSAWKIAKRIGDTPHMMGGRMKYSAWLGFSVPAVKDEPNAEKAKKALLGVKGVGQVATYPKQRIIAVSFKGEKEVSTEDLLDVLSTAGFKARTY